MREFFLFFILTIFITGCQQEGSSYPFMLNTYKLTSNEGVNLNSLAYKSEEASKNRENRLKKSEIDANAKIEIAKIESESKLKIAKVNAEVKKEVVHTTSKTKIKTSEIDSRTKKEEIESQLYVAIALIILVMLALILLYFNSKKNRELKIQLQQEELAHAKELREREFEETRMHKMLELIAEGKLSNEMEQEVILALTQPKTTTIEMIEK